jgi:hypothetical protein
MRYFWLVAVCSVEFVCSVAFSADAPGPYIAVRVDYFLGEPVRAVGAGPPRIGEQRGSGVVVASADAGAWFILTNAHVVEAGEPVQRAVPRVFAQGHWRKGRVIAADDESDLALIRIRSAIPLNSVLPGEKMPASAAKVVTHGLIGGTTYCVRETELRHALPLPGGALAWAPHRFYVRTMFRPGESGGAVTLENRLVGLIHGNDPAAGWGLIVDTASIREFLKANAATATSLR